MKPLARAALAALLVAPLPALALPCADFTDVEDTSAFCPGVEWLKNRAITVGCTSTTLYCPTPAVSRLAMAAFMQRLGSVLTPSIHYDDGSGGALDLDAPPATVCDTGPIPSASYPRTASAAAALSAQFTTHAAVAARLVLSTDQGVSWTPLHVHPASAGGPNRWAQASVAQAHVVLPAGGSVRIGLRAERASGSPTADVAAWRCQLAVVVHSRNGTATPF